MSTTSIANSGFGVGITFSSGFCAEITNVTLDGMEVKSHETTHNAITDGWRVFLPGKLKDPGKVNVDLQFDPDSQPPIGQTPEEITITFPTPAGASSGATMVCTGYMESFSAALPMDDKMTCKAVLKLTGAQSWTAHNA